MDLPVLALLLSAYPYRHDKDTSIATEPLTQQCVRQLHYITGDIIDIVLTSTYPAAFRLSSHDTTITRQPVMPP